MDVIEIDGGPPPERRKVARYKITIEAMDGTGAGIYGSEMMVSADLVRKGVIDIMAETFMRQWSDLREFEKRNGIVDGELEV